MSYQYDSSDDSSSESSSEWIDSTSTDSSGADDCNEPEPKKQKKSNSVDKEFIETEVNYDHMLKANFKWTINDFPKICQYKIGEKIESPIFTVGFEDEFKWRLILYPRGSNEQCKNYVSIYLYLVYSKEPKMNVQYKCAILTSKKRETNDLQGEENFIAGQRFGFKRLIKTDTILMSSQILDHKRLTITCDINAQLSKAPINKIKIVNDLKSLLDSGSYSDVVLEVENKKLKAHKYILAARSPVFAAMFKHDMQENKQNIVEITDIDYICMKEVLRFIYTGEVENLDTAAKDLLAAADKYAFEDLKNMCENALFKSLTVNNVVDILSFAELHSAAKLKEQALKYFVLHVEDVINTQSFKTMGNLQSPLLAQVICKMALQKRN